MVSSHSNSSIISSFFWIVFCLSILSHATATDTLNSGQSLSTIDGSTLISKNGVFELGFFSPGNSSNQYVAIWYHNISKQDTIWVANRDSPIPPSSSAFLVLTNAGNLEINFESANGNVTIWSTNTSSRNTTMLQLSDEGNLILQDSQNRILWQSFDQPENTFIQGMHMGINIRTGARQLYTCWRRADDPTPGNFSLGLDPSGSTQVFIWKDYTVKYWRSGEWNGASNFIGIPWVPLYSKGFTFVTDGDQKYYTFTAINDSLARFILHWNGTFSSYMYTGSSRGWDGLWHQPVKQCEIYNACGPNGLCRNNGNLASCRCLDGYQPQSAHDWRAGNWSGGCVRQATLQCQADKKQSEYKRLPGMKLPDHTLRTSDIGDSDACKNYCSRNCSCNAYAYVTTVGCMMWSGDLIDLYHFDNGGYDLYVKVPQGSNNEKTAIITGTVSAFVVFLLVASIFLSKKGYLNRSHRSKEATRAFLRSKQDSTKQSQSAYEIEHINDFELQLFSFDCIAVATSNFCSSNKLGEGGFGRVYKGKLPGGEEIAVKRLSPTSRQGIEEFKNEVVLIAKLQHRNLVRLLGCCIQREKLLIYEYLSNKSLDAFLFDPSKRGLLDWRKRFKIIEGIARGLLYLHRDSRLRVVHRDLKASNILLDNDMDPKISDFGMARIFGGDQNQHNTIHVVGTFGYMAPEYAMEGIFSVKSDVYSFGILLLEIITGKKNSSFHNKEDSLNIVGYAYKKWKEGNTDDLIDPTIRELCSTSQVLRCLHVALLCVQDLALDRPEIPSLISMILSERTNLPVPRQPTFTVQGYSCDNCALKRNADMISECGVTITSLQGR